jgi:hypothetical protein
MSWQSRVLLDFTVSGPRYELLLKCAVSGCGTWAEKHCLNVCSELAHKVQSNLALAWSDLGKTCKPRREQEEIRQRLQPDPYFC